MEDVVLTDGEVADLLKVSRSTVRRMWWRKQLPAPIKIGTINRWRRSEIETWLAEQPAHELYRDGKERRLV
jgi:excisionase family DNA binding protein